MACPVLAQHESWRQHESRLAMTKTYTQVLFAILLVWFHVRLCGAFCGCSDLQPLALPFTTGLRHGFHLCLLILGTFPMQILPRHMPHPGHKRTVLGRHGSWRGGYCQTDPTSWGGDLALLSNGTRCLTLSLGEIMCFEGFPKIVELARLASPFFNH